MKRTYLLSLSVFLSFFYCGHLLGQSCLPNGINFGSQQSIDDFATNYPGCTEIGGSVYIDGYNSSVIKNLNGLSQITSIQGSLRIIENFGLDSLTGLDNLTFVGGSLKLDRNGDVPNLLTLSNLTSIGGLWLLRVILI